MATRFLVLDFELFLECISHPDHPLGPVVWLDTSGLRPRPIRIELTVPFQCPQLLEGHLASGPVGKETVLRSAMPVDTQSLHLVVVGPQQGCAVSHFIGIIRRSGPPIHPPALRENGDIVAPSDLMGPPVVFGRPSSPEVSQSSRYVAHPAIRSVATLISTR